MAHITPPSAFQIENAMTVLLQARASLLEADPNILDDERLFSDSLEGESGDCMEVLHRILQAAVQAGDYAEMLKDRAKTMRLRADRWDARNQALRAAVLNALEMLGLPRLIFEDITASVAAGRKRVHVADVEELPAVFVKVTKEPRLTDIRKAIEDGDDVAGATLSNAPQTLRVSTT